MAPPELNLPEPKWPLPDAVGTEGTGTEMHGTALL